MGLIRRKHSPAVARNDRKFIGRTESPRGLQIVAAEGSRVRDVRGRAFIDFQMGWCVGNLGWNPPEILARVQAFKGPSYVAPQDSYEPWSELARRLAQIAPGKLERAYRCVGGSEAVELALQLAIAFTGRHKLISLEDAYHGNTIAGRNVGSRDFDAKLPGMKKLAPPLDERALSRLERLLAPRDVAALIMEPIAMNLNVLIPDGAFMREVVELCHRYGTLVIADEVACGFGRTGKLFASEHYDLEPDLMCIAKALGGGVAPIASVLATAEIADEIQDGDYDFYSTFGWMPLATEAALATLDIWQSRGREILDNTAERSNQLRRGLGSIFPDAELHVMGVAVGLEIEDEERIEKIETRCRNHGLLVVAEDDALMMLPACTVDEDTVDEALAILEEAASRVLTPR
jgi:acetylornithine/succinyldiaminopimelate/putrescine aminotransferase